MRFSIKKIHKNKAVSILTKLTDRHMHGVLGFVLLVITPACATKLISQSDCKEVCAPSQSQGNIGSSAPSQLQGNVGASPRLDSQNGVSRQQEAVPLVLPQLNRLFQTSFSRDESSVSNAGVAAIPSQFRVTQQILLHWQPFRDLKLKFVGSRRGEQLNLRSQQRIVVTVEESVLRMEMDDL